jgi:hypothetical protein
VDCGGIGGEKRGVINVEEDTQLPFLKKRNRGSDQRISRISRFLRVSVQEKNFSSTLLFFFKKVRKEDDPVIQVVVIQRRVRKGVDHPRMIRDDPADPP